MSYQHMFYGVDINRLKKLYGSSDEAFAADLLIAQAEAIANNDGFFEDYDGDIPSSETALRDILAGKAPRQCMGTF